MSRLTVAGLTKRYGGHEVLRNVSFELRGRSLALVGPNGAGKTTLLSTLAGVVRPTRGRITLEGREVAGLPVWKIARLGMVKTHQVVRPLRELSVEEHLTLFSRDRAGSARDRILRATALEEFRDRPAGELPFGALKRLELAEALATGATLLLLDEPIGGLSRGEAEGILATLRALRQEGQAMIIVEHRLREILPFVDDVVALDRGVVIYDGPPAGFYRSEAVRQAYLGGPHAAG